MATIKADHIKPVYDAVRSNNDPTNWLTLQYENANTIDLQASGSGGISELVSHLADDNCQYAYARIEFTEDGTKRTKFALIYWAGPNAPGMRKGKMSVHKASVKTVISDYTIEISSGEKDELEEKDLIEKIKKVNY